MTAAVMGRRLQRQGRGARSVLLGVSAATTAAVVLFLVGLAISSQTSSPAGADERDQAGLSAYEKELVPVLAEGGKTVELGVKVGIGDLEAAWSTASGGHLVAPEVIARQAASWAADLNRLADRVEAISAPPNLTDSNAMFIAALHTYAHSASIVVEAATTADAGERVRLLQAARDTGRSADKQFDVASALLQAERRRLGLAPSPDFPDPTSS